MITTSVLIKIKDIVYNKRMDEYTCHEGVFLSHKIHDKHDKALMRSHYWEVQSHEGYFVAACICMPTPAYVYKKTLSQKIKSENVGI